MSLPPVPLQHSEEVLPVLHEGCLADLFPIALCELPQDAGGWAKLLALRLLERLAELRRGEIHERLRPRKQRPWQARWSRYVRVHDVEFIKGPLSNGVSL
jgi:hypothetical protein